MSWPFLFISLRLLMPFQLADWPCYFLQRLSALQIMFLFFCKKIICKALSPFTGVRRFRSVARQLLAPIVVVFTSTVSFLLGIIPSAVE